MQLECEGARLKSIMGRGRHVRFALLLVLVRCRQAPVTPATPACEPVPLVHTAWLPRSCSPGDMAAATMQYDSGTGGAMGAEAAPASPVPPGRASMLSGGRLIGRGRTRRGERPGPGGIGLSRGGSGGLGLNGGGGAAGHRVRWEHIGA